MFLCCCLSAAILCETSFLFILYPMAKRRRNVASFSLQPCTQTSQPFVFFISFVRRERVLCVSVGPTRHNEESGERGKLMAHWVPMKNERGKRRVERQKQRQGFKRKIDLMSFNIKPDRKTLWGLFSSLSISLSWCVAFFLSLASLSVAFNLVTKSNDRQAHFKRS